MQFLDNRKNPAVVGHTGPHRCELSSIYPFVWDQPASGPSVLHSPHHSLACPSLCWHQSSYTCSFTHLHLSGPPEWSLRHLSSLFWDLALTRGPHAGVSAGSPAEPAPSACLRGSQTCFLIPERPEAGIPSAFWPAILCRVPVRGTRGPLGYV